jgi:hypothetical protein
MREILERRMGELADDLAAKVTEVDEGAWIQNQKGYCLFGPFRRTKL